jgi:hypothetical protein
VVNITPNAINENFIGIKSKVGYAQPELFPFGHNCYSRTRKKSAFLKKGADWSAAFGPTRHETEAKIEELKPLSLGRSSLPKNRKAHAQ